MSVKIGWHDEEQTLLQLDLASPWDWTEFEQAMNQGLEMVTAGGHPTQILIDFSGSVQPPRGNSLMYLKRVMQDMAAHPLVGETYLINPNPFARSLIDMLHRVYKESRSLHVVKNREEALRSIAALAEGGPNN